MMMHLPPHPGRIVRSNLEALDVSISKSAEALGVDRSQLHRVISGKSAISPEMAMRLEKVIGSTADHWMRMQTAFELAGRAARFHPYESTEQPKADEDFANG